MDKYNGYKGFDKIVENPLERHPAFEYSMESSNPRACFYESFLTALAAAASLFIYLFVVLSGHFLTLPKV